MSTLDDFDAVSSATPSAAPTQSGSILQAFDDAARAASAPPPPPAPPSSKTDRFLTGVGDLYTKTSQLAAHAVDAVGLSGVADTFDKAVSDKTGLPYTPVGQFDQKVDQREQQYQASRASAGSDGFDWMRLFGNVANPVNYAVPQLGGASTLARVGSGALQGAVSNVISTPTTGEDLKNFWGSQAKLGAWGALGGGAGTVAAEASAPLVNKAVAPLRTLLNTGGKDSAPQADALASQAFKDKGIDPSAVNPDMFGWFRKQVQESLKSGEAPSPTTLANVAEASSLPVPVPLLRGQASRDPMQFAKEQNLRGIQGVGEPITDVLGQQNKALISNLDAMGAKNAPNVVDAGTTAISTIKKIDDQAKSSVTDAYNAFRNSTGKSLDVPLQGLAQDYARVAHDYGMDTIPQGVRNHLNDLGLLNGTQQKVFSVEDAENLLKVINKNYNRSNPQASAALDEIRRSVQGAIVQGTGADAAGTQAAQLAANARKMAAQRFSLIDSIPAYKAAITDTEPDKFIQKYFWNGNASEIGGLKRLLSLDPQALNTVKASVMGDLKQSALNNQSPENGIFSAAKYNGIVRDQNNTKRFQALFEPKEVQGLNSLGNVAEVAMLAPKASAVNTSNTTSAAVNAIQGAAKGGLPTKALSQIGGMDIPIASWAARGMAQHNGTKSLSSLVRQSTQPLSAADIDALNFLTKRSGAVGGVVGGSVLRQP